MDRQGVGVGGAVRVRRARQALLVVGRAAVVVADHDALVVAAVAAVPSARNGHCHYASGEPFPERDVATGPHPEPRVVPVPLVSRVTQAQQECRP